MKKKGNVYACMPAILPVLNVPGTCLGLAHLTPHRHEPERFRIPWIESKKPAGLIRENTCTLNASRVSPFSLFSGFSLRPQTPSLSKGNLAE